MACPDSYLLDVTKTLIGSFAGAGLAFMFNYFVRQNQKEEEQVAAGNVALSKLAHMTVSYLSYKKTVIDNRNRTIEGSPPTLPTWMQMTPISHEFDESLVIDIQSLAFLFAGSTKSVMNHVFVAQAAYRNMSYLQKQHYMDLTELQEKLHLMSPDDPSFKIDLAMAEQKMPPYLVRRIDTYNESILHSLSDDESRFFDALDALRQGLSSRLGNGRIINITIPNELRGLR